MGRFSLSKLGPRRSGITIYPLLAPIIAVLAAPSGATLAEGPLPPESHRPESGAAPHALIGTSSGVSEAPEGARECALGRTAHSASAKGKACPQLPKRLPLSSSRVNKPKAPHAGRPSEVITQSITNEAGDELEVSTALPSTPYKEPFNKDCSLYVPYLGASYNPCGYVTFYDSKWKSSEKAPDTNVEEDAEYDACGQPVSSGKTKGWHVIGTKYTLFGWHAGHEEEIPASNPAPCLGEWTLIYSWTQTFSDGETLTDSVEVPFLVTAEPLFPDKWGGGNPSELSCSQVCSNDPVNTATGDYFDTTTDLAIPGRGPGLAMARTYSSLAAHAGASSPLGRGWAFPYDMSLSVDPETGDATVTNSNGSQTTFESVAEGFTAAPQILATLVEGEEGSYTYALKARTFYTFDSSGQLTSIADLNGNETTLSYDEAGQLQSVADGASRSLTFSYDKAGRIKGVTDSTERSVSYGYDESGYLDEVTNLRGGHERFTYDEEGLLLTREDARGHTVLTNTYDSIGRIITQTDGLKNKTKFAYTGAEPFTTTLETNPRGYVTEYEYEKNVLIRRSKAAGTGYKASWTYEHDPETLGMTDVTDPNGHTTHATYDANGNQTSTEDALGHTTESVYDSLDDMTEYTNVEGVTTTYEYDERGNLLSSSTPLVGAEPAESRTITYTYGSEAHPGDVTAITDPDGNTTHFTYDNAGDLESATDAAGDEAIYTYDERGNRLTQVSPRGNGEGGGPSEYTTSFTYDKAGNRLTTTDPLSHERTWTYDADGNLETETDANGHTTTYAYDAANRLVSVERPESQTEKTTYDANGNVESQTDGLKHATIYSYDPLDKLEARTDPLGRTTDYRHYQGGQLRLIIYPNEESTFFDYDAANELTEVEYSDETPNVEYEYDKNGRRISMLDGTGETSYEYDSLGRLTATTNGHGDTTSYGYDLAGNETAITYPNGKTVTRAFDEAERLKSVTDWLGNTTNFEYDADSNLQSTAFPEGTENVDEYGYDPTDRMSEVEMSQGAKTLATLKYTRDGNGQLESLAAKGLPGSEEEAFGYDENSRLTQAGSEGFGYDAADNLTEAPETVNTYDAAGQLQAGNGVDYRYDKLGERTEARAPTAMYLSSIGSQGTAKGQFEHPAGLDVDVSGNLWVADEENNRVEEFSKEGKYITQFGSEGSGEGQFERPTDVAVDEKGNVWVADTGNSRVEEFDKKGKYIRQFGSEGSGEGEFAEPESIAIDPGGDVWVADTHNGRLQEISKEGKFIKIVSEYGEEEGQMIEPTGIAICSGGEIWVADWGAERVEKFDSKGKFVLQFGSFGSGKGQFEEPGSIEVDGFVWVTDEGNDRIQKFSWTGEYLGEFGNPGSAKGQFNLGWPMGIATDGYGNIWVSDAGNNRVQKWEASASSGAPSTSYEYDLAGNLTSVERPKAEGVAEIDEAYAYDGTGLRASQTVSGTTSHLTWDQSSRLPLLLSDGQASYIYGPGGLPIEQVSSKGTPTFYHHDQLGSTRVLTDASGTVTATFTYGAYGTAVGSTGTQTTPFGYAGQYTNVESGLQYLRARTYDPSTGQFLSRDPLADITGTPYSYASTNPLSYSDPSGLCNANPFTGSFWTEGNCISESSLNPLKYYEEEIEAWENGCGYWDSVLHGVEGAVVLTIDAAGILVPAAIAPDALAAADYWAEQFAIRYPKLYAFLLSRAANSGGGPPITGIAAFFARWIEQHLQ